MGGWVGSGLEFYNPNPTWPAIKIFFLTQPNPPSFKNWPNLVGWVGSSRWVGCTPITIGELIFEKKKLQRLGWSTTATNGIPGAASCLNCFFFSAFPFLKIYKTTLSFLKSLQINQRFLLRSEMHLSVGIRYLSRYSQNNSGMANI